MRNNSGLRQIKASAGSGKTYSLTGRYLQALQKCAPSPKSRQWACSLSPSNAPAGFGEILAITFTNAAATEMRSRVIERLKKISLGNVEPDLQISAQDARNWLNVLLADMASLNIRTIDSLLHMIVRSSALELDLNPNFEPSFDLMEVFEPYIAQFAMEAETNPRYRELLARAIAASVEHAESKGFLGGSLFRNRLKQVLKQTMLEAFTEIAPPEILRDLLENLRTSTQSSAAEFLQLADLGGLSLRVDAVKAIQAHANGNFNKGELSAYAQKSGAAELLLKVSAAPTPEIEDAYQKYSLNVKNFYVARTVCDKGAELSAFVDIASELACKFKSAGLENKTLLADLMPRYAASILNEGHGVSDAICRLGTRLSHFLVDEFQDTSREQWQVLRFLVQEALARGGSMTWVGDVKQSIYGWRGAAPALFDQVKNDQELTAICPDVTSDLLSQNWRSKAEIVRHNNEIFSQLAKPGIASSILKSMLPNAFPEEMLDSAVHSLIHTYADAQQKIDPANASGGYVRVEKLSAVNAAELSRIILDKLSSLLQVQIRGRRPWSDVLVLCRSREQCKDVAAHLIKIGIPVITEHSLLLGSHPLIRQLLAFLKFVYNPEDNIAFLTLVTGSIFIDSNFADNVTGEQLLDWASGVNAPLYTIFAIQYPRLWSIIRPFVAEMGLFTPYDLISEWLARLSVQERFLEDQIFIRRFLEVIYAAELQDKGSLADFIEFWTQKGSEEQAPVPSSMNAVRVMTIHKAKGLEAPVVIAPFLNFGVRASDAVGVAQYADLKVPVLLNSQAAGADYYQNLLNQALETVNLLYVTLTRACDELYWFLPTSPRQNKGIKNAMDVLLKELNWDKIIEEKPIEWGVMEALTCPGENGELQETCGCLVRQPDLQTDWQPLGWLPRLKIFRAHPAEAELTARERGIFMHFCLEKLRFDGDPQQDARQALETGLLNTPFHVPEQSYPTLLKALTWFANLPQAQDWLQTGWPEHTILTADGSIMRVDLLVPRGAACLVIDYKTGDPHEAHHKQVRTYMDCIEQSGQFPAGVTGILIYLDLQRIQIVGADSESGLPNIPVTASSQS